MSPVVQAAAIFGIAYGVASLLTPIVIALAHRVGALDHPGGRKTHEADIPRIGGIAIVVATAVAMMPGLLLPAVQPMVARNVNFLAALVCGGGLVFALGLWDDLKGANAPGKFFFQTIAAVVVYLLGFGFEQVNLPFLGATELGLWSLPLSIVWVVGVINAVNLIDGLDGLAAGLSLIICATVGAIAIFRGDTVTPLVLTALAGALVAFLRYNWNPARIFMGDCGSMFIGFVLAVLAMRSSTKGPTAVAITVPILALGVPVIDTLFVMWFRFFREAGGASLVGRTLRMFRADRNHLHHLVVDFLRGHHRRAVAVIYALAVLFALSAASVAWSNSASHGIVLLSLGVVAVAAVRLQLERVRLARGEVEGVEPPRNPALPADDADLLEAPLEIR